MLFVNIMKLICLRQLFISHLEISTNSLSLATAQFSSSLFMNLIEEKKENEHEKKKKTVTRTSYRFIFTFFVYVSIIIFFSSLKRDISSMSFKGERKKKIK